MDRFYDVSLEEQETIINIDYYKKQVLIYTSRKVVYDRIVKKLGDPFKIYYSKGQISGANWIIPFKNKKNITSILSRPILIGDMK